jgi:hypothetical protein
LIPTAAATTTYSDRFLCQKKKSVKPGDRNGCGKTFVCHQPDVVQQMPAFVQQHFPFVKVGRKYVTRRVVRLVRDTMAEAGKLAAAITILESQHKAKHLETELQYYQTCSYLRAVFPALKQQPPPPKFPQYLDPAYAGARISHHLVRAIFKQDGEAREAFQDRNMMMQILGYILKLDESYKFIKAMKVNGGEQAHDSILLIMNGTHSVVSFLCSEDQSHASFEATVKGLAARIEQYGYEAPRIMYSDQCCRDKNFLLSVLPSLKDDRGMVEGEQGILPCVFRRLDATTHSIPIHPHLPPTDAPRRVVALPDGALEYVETAGQCTTAVDAILRHLQQQPPRSQYFSLAAEWVVFPGEHRLTYSFWGAFYLFFYTFAYSHLPPQPHPHRQV